MVLLFRDIGLRNESRRGGCLHLIFRAWDFWSGRPYHSDLVTQNVAEAFLNPRLNAESF